MPTSTTPSTIFAVAAPSSRCARQFMLPRTRKGSAMNHMPTFNRRSFIVGTAAVGTGLAIGFDVPFGGPTVVRAADGSPEVNAWVVIQPNDTVVIRIAR